MQPSSNSGETQPRRPRGGLPTGAASDNAAQQSKPRPRPARDLATVREQALQCRDCPLWEPAIQTVFGGGNENARVVFVGEQPGDKEDRAGEPFVGPAGQLLDRALIRAGIDRSETYVTNAVKHFKFEPRGKRRLHKSPAVREMAACQQWLIQELEMISPQIIVALGATAARSLLGSQVSVRGHRGTWTTAEGGRQIFLTVHPSYLLRLRGDSREAEYERFVGELGMVRDRLEQLRSIVH